MISPQSELIAGYSLFDKDKGFFDRFTIPLDSREVLSNLIPTMCGRRVFSRVKRCLQFATEFLFNFNFSLHHISLRQAKSAMAMTLIDRRMFADNPE